MAEEKKYKYATPAAAEGAIEEARKSGADSLSLKDYGLKALPESIAGLTKLEHLDLDDNRFTSVPACLRRLPKLWVLLLRKNGLSTLSEDAFAGLQQLQILGLGGNGLTTLPEKLFAALQQLQALDLSTNGLTTIPEKVFAGLQQLQRLDLGTNGLTMLPSSLEECYRLKSLSLHRNPVLGLTDEVLGTSPATILAAWRAMQRGGRWALNEAKVILVGRGGAGKTTLRKAMMEEAISEREDRTDGIELSRFDLKVGDADVGLNVWDFGGQEVMYSTHRFFLTSRSLYLLVLDARSGPQDENVDYWLRVVEELGKMPPVLVVLNHVDENRALSLDETGWRAKYPFIAGFARTCAKTREGLPELLDKMSGTILTHLPQARAAFPAAWFSVKDKLTEMKDKLGREYLKMEEYEKLCKEEKIPDGERLALLCLVRDLGLVSCYPEVPELKDLGVLRPGWLTDGIYSLITNSALKQKGGRILMEEVKGYLRGDPARYAGHERFLLDATGHFRLGFQMSGSKEWLLTALLDENTPKGLADWQTAAGLKLEMRYRVLPEGLVAQFISLAHKLTESEGLRRWRNGTELRMDEATALVQGDVPARHIRILVQGPGNSPRALLTCIRQHFRTINAGLTPPEEYVPVPDLDADPVKYSDLLAREAQGRATMEVTDRKGTVHDVPVAMMLDRYATKSDRSQEIAERKQRVLDEDFRAAVDDIKAKRLEKFPHRFDVAFSFAGAHRDTVRAIATLVRDRLGQGKVFFDEWFEPEILGDDMDTLLQRFYHEQSLMVVADLSDVYPDRPWCQAEARAIRALRMKLDSARDETARLRLLNIRLGPGDVPGVFANTGYLDGVNKTPEQCAAVILERLALLKQRLAES